MKPSIACDIFIEMIFILGELQLQYNNIIINFLLFLLHLQDILFNFRTTFVNKKGEVVYSQKEIAFNYISGLFSELFFCGHKMKIILKES